MTIEWEIRAPGEDALKQAVCKWEEERLKEADFDIDSQSPLRLLLHIVSLMQANGSRLPLFQLIGRAALFTLNDVYFYTDIPLDYATSEDVVLGCLVYAIAATQTQLDVPFLGMLAAHIFELSDGIVDFYDSWPTAKLHHCAEIIDYLMDLNEVRD